MGIQHYLKTSIVVVIAKRMRGLVLVVFKHKTGWRKIWGAHRPFAKTPKMHKIGGCRAKYTIAATIIWRACLLRGDHRFWAQPRAFVVLAMRNHQLSYVFDIRYVHISALQRFCLNGEVKCVWVRSLKG